MTIQHYCAPLGNIKKNDLDKSKFNSEASEYNLIKHWRDVKDDDIPLLETENHLTINPLLLMSVKKKLNISKKIWGFLVVLFCNFKPRQVHLLQDSIFRTTATVEKMLS